MHENAGKFIERSWLYTKETSVQVLYPTHSLIQLSIVVLQQSFTHISTQRTWKNVEKDSYMDHRSICTSPTLGIEAIAGLITIYLHLQKLNRKFHLWAYSLPPNHIINSILNPRDSSNQEPYWLLLDKLTPRQCSIIKGPLVDMDNRYNEIFPFFSPFNCKFSLGNRFINVFPNCFSFHTLSRKKNHDIKSHL